MDNFTKRRLKKPREIVKDLKDGNFSLTKRQFDMDKSKKTFKKLSKDGEKIKTKVTKLKKIQFNLFNKDSLERQNFIDRKKPYNLK